MDFITGIPKLNSNISYNELQLTPTEGYFLSRIDGVSSVEDIASVSGLPYDESIDVLKTLWAKGIFVIEGLEMTLQNGQMNNIELTEDEKNAIEKMAKLIKEGTFYQILSVPFDAKPEQIKMKFFELSKIYHPDRYFRKNIGHYKDMLTMIFKKLSDVYDTLYDLKKKQMYNTVLKKLVLQKNQPVRPADTGKSSPAPIEKDLQKPRADTVAERTVKIERQENDNPDIGGMILSIKNKLSSGMVEQAIEEVDRLADKGIRETLLPLLIAKHYLNRDDYITAKGYVQKAIEYDNNNIEAYELLGSIYFKFKLYRNAIKVYETILRIQPENVLANKKIMDIKTLMVNKYG